MNDLEGYRLQPHSKGVVSHQKCCTGPPAQTLQLKQPRGEPLCQSISARDREEDNAFTSHHCVATGCSTAGTVDTTAI